MCYTMDYLNLKAFSAVLLRCDGRGSYSLFRSKILLLKCVSISLEELSTTSLHDYWTGGSGDESSFINS